MTTRTEQLYAAALAAIPHWGGQTIRTLYESLGSCEAIWQAPVETLQAYVAGTAAQWEAFSEAKATYDWDGAIRFLAAYDARLVTLWEDEYPPLLKETYNPPVVLYYWGTLPVQDKAIAIVGARKATAYGLNAAQTIAEELSCHGVTIVSGGARGIDTKAHRGALQVEGKTVAVVGHGLDRVYPRENKKLFRQIAENGGCVLTEYAFGVPPLALNFPARNRIIAGLSRGVIVVEAALRSGSLITADFALEEGRDVFTVPGSIFSTMSRGTNELLRKGGIALTKSEDVLQEYQWQAAVPIQRQEPVSLTLSEALVFDTLGCDKTLSQEELVVTTQLLPAELSPILLRLQLYGLIEEVQRGQYLKKAHT